MKVEGGDPTQREKKGCRTFSPDVAEKEARLEEVAHHS